MNSTTDLDRYTLGSVAESEIKDSHLSSREEDGDRLRSSTVDSDRNTFGTIPESELKDEPYSLRDRNYSYLNGSEVESGGYSLSPKKQQWVTDVDEEKFKILDPDDPLMKRFQDALKSHLRRIDNKLTDEISELVRSRT